MNKRVIVLLGFGLIGLLVHDLSCATLVAKYTFAMHWYLIYPIGLAGLFMLQSLVFILVPRGRDCVGAHSRNMVDSATGLPKVLARSWAKRNC